MLAAWREDLPLLPSAHCQLQTSPRSSQILRSQRNTLRYAYNNNYILYINETIVADHLLHQRKLSQLLFKAAFEVWIVSARAATPDLACFHHFIEGEPSIVLLHHRHLGCHQGAGRGHSQVTAADNLIEDNCALY